MSGEGKVEGNTPAEKKHGGWVWKVPNRTNKISDAVVENGKAHIALFPAE